VKPQISFTDKTEKITGYLQTEKIGQKIIMLAAIDSTNSELRRRASMEDEGTVILCEQQTGGRGRMGRTWISPKGKGIWMSILLKPELPPADIPQITIIGAAAVTVALEKNEPDLADKISVKWPNDVLLNDRKICGILTEMQIRGNRVQSVVLGIGLNLYLEEDDFPQGLVEQATSLLIETGKHTDREIVTAEILNNFEILYKSFIAKESIEDSLEVCRRNSAVIGRKVILDEHGLRQEAEVIDLGPKGELVVRLQDESVVSIVSGEISLRRTANSGMELKKEP